MNEYERKRAETIARNARVIQELGFERETQAMSIIASARVANKRLASTKLKRTVDVASPGRRSGRLSGNPAPLYTEAHDDLVETVDVPLRKMTRQANNRPRPSSAQRAFLRKYAGEAEASLDLTVSQKQAAAEVRKAFDAMGYEKEADAVQNGMMSASIDLRPPPAWLAEFEELLRAGQFTKGRPSQQNVDRIVNRVRRWVSGIGKGYKAWPDDVILLKDEVLSLGCDIEEYRERGNRCEDMYGHDKGNGWLYNHALQKVKLFQAFLLQREGQGDMAGPTWAEEYAGATDFEALLPDATMAKITVEAGVQSLDERVNLRARNLQAKRAAMDDPTRAESAESEQTLGGSPKWNMHGRRNRKHKADEATVPIEREPFNSLPEA